MALVKRDRPLMRWPWPEDRFDRMLREMTRGWLGDQATRGEAWPLHVEEYVEDGTCVVRAELPGIDPDKGLEVEIADGAVHIKAHREERSKEELPDGYRSEFRYGAFERFVPLPDGASDAEVKASYRDGILEVRVPLPAAEQKTEPVRIVIDRG